MITAMSKPLPNLPADVWLYIFQLFNDEYDEYDKRAVISLASVNKFLRGIGLPVLFRTLSLSAPESPELDDDHLGNVIGRVRAINASPHVLNAVCRLTLTNWWICPDDDDMSDGSIESDDHVPSVRLVGCINMSNPQVDGYREIFALIPHLPRLDHLVCHNCSFTLESLSQIFEIPNLQSLHIHNNSIVPDGPTKCQIAVANSSLCVFQCTFGHWGELHETNTVELIIPLIGQLIVSCFPFNVLAHILVDQNLPITLPKLQKLSLFSYHPTDLDSSGDLVHFRNFLSLTPNLCELRIISDIHMETPFVIPDTAIPRLKTLIAPSYIANGIASGRALEKLHILAFRSRNFRESYTVVSRDIKHVVYSGALNNPEEDLSHLAQVFPSASTVEIMAVEDCIPTFQEFSNVVLSILPKFRHLKQCMVFPETSYSVPDYSCPPSYCPVGRVDDPKYRSHPTLEDLQILSFYRWIWCPKGGWHSFRSCYEDGALYTVEFFKRLCIFKY